jgi:NTE family protein
MERSRWTLMCVRPRKFVGTEVESSPAKKVNLALQGGGAHGAFVWGVLDHLLDDGRLAIEAISATSAGAMNAVALASGMATGGPACARQRLHDFWFEV